MQEYIVKTKFIFEGEFYIKAENKQQAKEFAEKHCGLVMGGNIHSILNDEDVDWNFNIHPDKLIGKITKQ